MTAPGKQHQEARLCGLAGVRLANRAKSRLHLGSHLRTCLLTLFFAPGTSSGLAVWSSASPQMPAESIAPRSASLIRQVLCALGGVRAGRRLTEQKPPAQEKWQLVQKNALKKDLAALTDR